MKDRPRTWRKHLPRLVRRALAVAGIAMLMLGGGVGNGVAAVPRPAPVASISPAPGEVVGVGMPVTVTFAEAVANRAVAEHSIAFSSPATPSGSFAWLSDDV